MRSRRRMRTGWDPAWRIVRRIRPPGPGTGIAVAAVAAGLALTGCGSSGGHGDADRTPTVSVTGSGPATTPPASSTSSGPTTPATSGTPTGTPTTSPSGGSGAIDDHSVQGVWLATAGGTKVQLVLGKGTAGLTSSSLCGGAYTDHGGLVLNLTCMDGNKERTFGHGVLAADGKTLTVQWTGGPTDTFSRTGLPSN